MKPSYMFSSATERDPTDPAIEEAPGPQDYENQGLHSLKKDFSRPRIVIASPTRNTDGAIRTELYVASNELKYKNLSPGPVPILEYPDDKKARERTEPRLRQYGLNMITNTLQDPEQIKSNNEVAKAALKKRLITNEPPGPGQYNPVKQPIGPHTSRNSTLDNISDLRKVKDKSVLLGKLGF